ncbi:aldehyde dehydrogenase family protein [Pseudomonas sp. B19125]
MAQTPLTALKLASLIATVFPAGVVNVVFGRGPTVGKPLTTHEKVRMVCFMDEQYVLSVR